MENIDYKDYSAGSVIPEKMLISSYPTFFFREKVLTKENIQIDNIELGFALIESYNFNLLIATIKALGCSAVEINVDRLSSIEGRFSFIRDPVVVLHDKKLILSTEMSEVYGSSAIITKMRELTDFKSLLIQNAYFEGGNIFYLPDKKTLIHGLEPGGRYGVIRPSFYNEKNRLRYSTFDPADTNIKLSSELKLYDINVIGLRMNPAVIRAAMGKIHGDYYFHLDCFMQLLPDGRMIILNKEMLSKDSQVILTQLLGKNLIDLGYEFYIDFPVSLNFISIPMGHKTHIITARIPDSIINSLAKLNLEVITPQSLDSKSHHYNAKLAANVLIHLQIQGYEIDDPAKIRAIVPKNRRGYKIDDGEILGSSLRDKALGRDEIALDVFYDSQNKISFEEGYGGPHCLTNEVPIASLKRP